MSVLDFAVPISTGPVGADYISACFHDQPAEADLLHLCLSCWCPDLEVQLQLRSQDGPVSAGQCPMPWGVLHCLRTKPFQQLAATDLLGCPLFWGGTSSALQLDRPPTRRHPCSLSFR